MKPDFSTLLPLFSVVYFKDARDGSRARDGTESKVMQPILLGRADKADGYLLYSPFTKEFYVSSDCKINSGTSTATMFNLKYDGGLFLGLYDSSDVANGVEPYPPGTSITYSSHDGKEFAGTVTSAPLTGHDKDFPSSSSTPIRYSVRLSSGEIVVFSPEQLDLIMNSRFDHKPPNLPQWLHNDGKIMLFHNNVYLKGWLTYEESSGWEFQICKRNGDVRFRTPLPHLLTKHSTMIENKHLLPGWSNSVRQFVATAKLCLLGI